MENDSLGVSHNNGLPPRPFLLQAAPALSWGRPQSPRGIETGSLYEGSFGLMRLRGERDRMSLDLAVSHPKGTEKLEELRTLNTSPGTQQFYLLVGIEGKPQI